MRFAASIFFLPTSMAEEREGAYPSNPKWSKTLERFGWDALLFSIAAFHLFNAPYTKVEESFNVQASHDILHHHHHLEKYDHLDFPGVVSRTFIGAIFLSLLASPITIVVQILQLPKIYSLYAVRLVLGSFVWSTLRFFRIQVKREFGNQVEAFFVLLTALQFHFLFYCTRPLPNILALGFVNLAYAFWVKGRGLATLKCLIFATVVFRCDTALLLGPIGLALLLNKSVSLWEALKDCIGTALLCIGFTTLVDSLMWQKIVWPELEVFWFNSVLNRSSEWGTHPFHWYFTSALPRALLAAYPLCLLGVLFDRRILRYFFPVFTFVLLYSKLPHKELRFIIGSIPIFNLSGAIAASRIFNNRRKNIWIWLYLLMVGSLLFSLGITIITSRASYENYPSAYALKALHLADGDSYNMMGQWVHIDTFSAMNGISRFCENDFPWRGKVSKWRQESHLGKRILPDLVLTSRSNMLPVMIFSTMPVNTEKPITGSISKQPVKTKSVSPIPRKDWALRGSHDIDSGRDYESRYSKEEGIPLEEFHNRNFTYLLNEHSSIDGFKCLFAINGFSRVHLQRTFPPIILLKDPKVFVHGNLRNQAISNRDWPGCP